MKLVMLSVYDRAAGAYARPMFVPSVGVGIRSFSDEVNRRDENNNLYNHSADFDLFHLGVFDDVSCSFELLDSPNCVAFGKQVRISEGE